MTTKHSSAAVAEATHVAPGIYQPELTKRKKKDLREVITKNINDYFHPRKGGEIETLAKIEKDLTTLNPGGRDEEINVLGIGPDRKRKIIEEFKKRREELDDHIKEMSRNN